MTFGSVGFLMKRCILPRTTVLSGGQATRASSPRAQRFSFYLTPWSHKVILIRSKGASSTYASCEDRLVAARAMMASMTPVLASA